MLVCFIYLVNFLFIQCLLDLHNDVFIGAFHHHEVAIDPQFTVLFFVSKQAHQLHDLNIAQTHYTLRYLLGGIAGSGGEGDVDIDKVLKKVYIAGFMYCPDLDFSLMTWACH